MGAAQVLGIDLSERMIELAQRQEAAHPLGITYQVGDGRDLALAEPQDLVLAAYLLNYARNRDELSAMCRGIARCLNPGGRFVTVNANPALDFSRAPSYRPYGFATTAQAPLREGTPVRWEFFLEEGPFSIENYHLDVAAHEEALRAAGFRDIRWHAPAVSAEGTAAFGTDYWKVFQQQPPVTFIECVK
jgi:SAM-dependent methyltransferase